MLKDYQIIRSLGVGATSEVFAAIRLADGQQLALKVFSPIVLSDADALKRLAAEVEALEKLRHPNVVTLFRQNHSEDFFALELELVVGCDLRQWLKDSKINLLEPKLWLLSQVAKGLGAAHEKGILHRDLKPENVLASHTGQIKLTDFGLARTIARVTMTRIGLLVGSLGYMAPEVINGEHATEQSDIFSFGVLAYEVLAGEAPFQGDSPQSLIKAMSDARYKPLSELRPAIPEDICKLIGRCLCQDPRKRLESIWSVDAELLNYLHRTQILPYCESLVSTACSQELLVKALEIKHRVLHDELKKLQPRLRTDALARKRLIGLANEMAEIFPQDTTAVELLTSQGFEFQNHRRRKRQFYMAIISCSLVVLFCLWRGITWPRSKSRPSSISSVQAAIPIAPIATLPTVALPIERAPKPALPHGAINFDIPEGVQVTIDDNAVAPSRLHHVSVIAGRHRVRMALPGYMPIEQFVDVGVDQTTVVRAQGDK